jgi:uncharacterized protein YraI
MRLTTRITVAAFAAAVIGVFGFGAAAYAAGGTVNTAGAALTIRSGPTTTAGSVGSVADGAHVTISCQIHGQSVSGTYGTSNVWDKIGAGFVADAYIYTGSDGLVAPLCGSASSCSVSGLGDPNSCATAVSWVKNHETTTYHAEYYNLCDHIAGLAYGFPASGSTTALAHWNSVPSGYKHSGSWDVPAGGLAFFGSGSGHVMVSIGGGLFVSNDIHGNGTLTQTTISEIVAVWGKPYLGWAQPWFQYNH